MSEQEKTAGLTVADMIEILKKEDPKEKLYDIFGAAILKVEHSVFDMTRDGKTKKNFDFA